MNQKKFFIKTFGCQMNVADTERMSALLSEGGMVETQDASQASLILINGCSVREKAVHKAVSFLGEMKVLKREEGDTRTNNEISWSKAGGPIIGLGGCVGQLDKGEIFKRAPYIDFVFGPDAIDQLPEIVHRAESGDKYKSYTEFDPLMSYSTETKIASAKAQAFVNIMKGCDKYCTYCIVPFTRGKEKSRTISEVLDDVAQLMKQGVKEVTLLGQNVNSFGKGNPNVAGLEPKELNNAIGKVGPRAGDENFPQLLRAMDSDPRLAGLKRIRFTSSHPLDFSDELIECYHPVTGVKKLAPHLHLPVQSGSDRVLQKMGRHHKIENYIAQMDRLKAIRPDIGLTTDIIVGFPSETEEDFMQTMNLLDRVQFDLIYAFAYSPRPGTRASKLPDDVYKKEKNQRLNRVLAHQLTIGEKTFARRVGKTLEILVEGSAKTQSMDHASGDSVWTGRTGCNVIVNFTSGESRNLIGKLLNVKITRSSSLSLTGELLVDPNHAESIATDSEAIWRNAPKNFAYKSPIQSEVVV
ncbi:MAG: tRNA (N6-isopentenyl adenosine(37)-C2)-methylthiotransferase MiaB [Xanthomonadaceae bacterium]|nr:tRNA (N6-isopentenyl adenosine(37)-C2)-methylthiotransferase MiaB [Xanthomonadaceae bacterium]